MSAIAQFNKKIVHFELQKQQLVKSLKKDLKAVLVELFTAVPEIKSIYWTQYTPYFNDGDACVFRMNDIIVSNSKNIFVDYPEDLLEDDEGNPLWATYANSPSKKYIRNPEHKKLIKDLAKLIDQSEDLIQKVFGNGVRVIGTKKGFRIEDYSDHQ